MDERPVGVMDSGLGGISVLGAMLRQLPHENYLYYGDTLHIPYGDKPPETVLSYTHDVVDELISRGCKAIVIACNTATSVAAGALRQELQLPIIGMEPALKPASLLPGDGTVLVLATKVTLTLPKFQALMALYGQNAVPVPCSGLMELVEAGETRGERVQALLSAILAPYLDRPVKAVVLGCTHYVFLRDAIAGFFPRGVKLVDGNDGTARQLLKRLRDNDLLAQSGSGQVTFFSSRKDARTLQRMQDMLTAAKALPSTSET